MMPKTYDLAHPAVQRIFLYFMRKSRPLLLGCIAVDIGLSLKQTQEVVDDLVDKGLLRPGTPEELRALCVRSDCNVYVAVEKFDKYILIRS